MSRPGADAPDHPDASVVPSVARAYRAAGLCVLPAHATEKRAAFNWQEYQRRLPLSEEIERWFSPRDSPTRVCLVCGEVSGNLEVLDFDCRGAAFEPWRELVERSQPGLFERLVIESSPSGGLHVVYRCGSPVDGNAKLAQRRDPGSGSVQTLIETRGEGGLFLCAPSPGYVLVQGSLENLPTLTADERDTLLTSARCLNEVAAPVIGGPQEIPPGHAGALRPGDDFTRRGNVGALLVKHQWKLFRDGENQHWTRPGKEAGTSATLKHGVLYVFTSNAAPFEPSRAYSGFAVYALLEHGGDYAAAASALRAEGYGAEPRAGAGQTNRSLAAADESLGTHDPETGRLILCRHRTLPTAQAYLRERHEHPSGETLVSYLGDFFEWRVAANRWALVEECAMRGRLHVWLHEALQAPRGRGADLQPFDANPRTVEDAAKSLQAFTHVGSEVALPAWRDGGSGLPPPSELIVCRNGSLHVPTGEFLSASPALLNLNALPFDFDPLAPAPERWLRFLGELWPHDPDSIALLQEWIGYCLTPDTSQQKMLLIVGPRRAGKGTIGRVVGALVGAGNVVGPSTGSLAESFGLAPLLGKHLAIVSDARFDGERMSQVVERLLCISGEDSVTVNRKNKDQVSVRLPTRFMFFTNETPALRDASGALAGRFLGLRLTRSFYGAEDLGLTKALLSELPGILLWAIDGWRRLDERGRFTQPRSAKSLLEDVESLGSPMLRFVRERCDVGRDKRVVGADLFQAHQRWRDASGLNAIDRQAFGRELAAAVPGVERRRGTDDVAFYQGVTLRAATLQPMEAS